MPGRNRPYDITHAAEADLEKVWLEGAQRWSVDAAQDYVGDLLNAMRRLAEHPSAYRERIDFDPPVRICPHRSHVLVYRIVADRVLIVRIRHGRENWAENPAG